MKCEACQTKPAVVHLTDVSNNQKREIHLCEECAKQKGVTIKSHMNKDPNFVFNLVETQSDPVKDEKDTRCPKCGITYRKFRSNGKFGCPNDYLVFRKGLINLLEKIHQKVQHVGKVPRRVNDVISQQNELNQLREELVRSIDTEAYERAAEIRDKIYLLEEKEQKSKS